MDLQLRGKRALVTGSTAGIGFAIAERLADEGATVIVNGRTPARVEEAVVRLSGEGRSVRGIAADLSTAAGAAHLIAGAGDVQILVNNLSIFEPKSFEDITDEDWYRFFETNLMSAIRLSRRWLPAMKAANWGRIVFISSESALHIPAEMIHYGMTKTAQLAISRGMAETTVGTNVTVNAVLPGPTASEGVTAFVGQLAKKEGVTAAQFERQFFETMRPTSLLKRFERPQEIAAVVAFVCSPLASAINGAAVRADGGVVRAVG